MNYTEFWALAQQKLTLDKNENGNFRVIFLCAGNICRSPFGEMKFEQLIQQSSLNSKDKFIISSGGFIDNSQVNLCNLTRQSLLDDGVPESRIALFHTRHMRKYKDELQSADVLIFFSKDNIELLYPKFREKAIVLSDIALGGRTEDIADPVLIKDYLLYRQSMQRITVFLQTIVRGFEARNL